LERQKLFRNIENCFNRHGHVSRRSRKKLEQLLLHPDPEIRRHAQSLAWESGDRSIADFLGAHCDFDDALFGECGFDVDFCECRFNGRRFDDAGGRTADRAGVWIESGPGMDDAVRYFDLIDVWIESGPWADDVFGASDLTGAWVESG
jgi:hypothetical protein